MNEPLKAFFVSAFAPTIHLFYDFFSSNSNPLYIPLSLSLSDEPLQGTKNTQREPKVESGGLFAIAAHI